jgi:UDP-N-acetylglucosamine--dolichyl-phosphate N-acetylglucosaminephosphotransferase
MNSVAIIAGVVVTGASAFVLSKVLAPRLKKIGMSGLDIHKPDKPETAEMGGLAVLLAIFPGVATLLILGYNPGTELLACLLTLTLVGLIGILDDIYAIRQRYKPILVVLASAPVMYVLEFRNSISLPIVGSVPVGILYPLIIVPVAITTSANFSNLLAGFNGLEGGIATISLTTVSALAWINGAEEVAALGFVLASAFFGFLLLNWYPAKLFPGDTGTLLSGAGLAVVGVAGGVEAAAIILSIPAAMDFTLKMVSRHPFQGRKVHGNTTVGPDGVLNPPAYPALAHAFMRVDRVSEKGIVVTLLAMELVYAALAVLGQSLVI